MSDILPETPPIPSRRDMLGINRLNELRERLQLQAAAIDPDPTPSPEPTPSVPFTQRLRDRLNPGLSRRRLVKHGIALFGLSQIPAWLLSACQGPSMDQSDSGREEDDYNFNEHFLGGTPDPEAEKNRPPIRFGFNTHLMPSPGEDPQDPQKLDLERFKAAIDMMSSNGLNSVRFNLFDHYIQQGEPTDEFSLNEAMLTQYDEAIEYAHRRGMHISLGVNVPEIYGELPDNEYQQIAAQYFNTIGARYAGKIDTWQIFNEPNIHHFKQYNVRPEVTPAYAQSFGQILAIARQNISAHDPSAKFTVNVSTWPLSSEDASERRRNLFDAIHTQVDILSLNIFPDSLEEADQLVFLMNLVRNRYNKPIQVGELGISTGPNDFSEQAQAEILIRSIAALRRSQDSPQEVLLYEYDDQSHLSDQHEGTFGLVDNPKILSIIASMQAQPSTIK